MIYTKKCPECNAEILYSCNKALKLSLRNNSICRSCSKIGHIVNKEARKKISRTLMGRKITENTKKKISNTLKSLYILGKINKVNHSGKNNPMYGKIHSKLARQNISKNTINVLKQPIHIDKMQHIYSSKKYKKTLSLALKGRIVSEDTKLKMRMSAIKRIEFDINGKILPSYNPEACKIIDEYGIVNGYNFQHALNGGEVCIGGYFPDGIDEKKKTIIEIDEKHHFNSDGTYTKKDIQRQTYLESLGYNVIRLKIGEI